MLRLRRAPTQYQLLAHELLTTVLAKYTYKELSSWCGIPPTTLKMLFYSTDGNEDAAKRLVHIYNYSGGPECLTTLHNSAPTTAAASGAYWSGCGASSPV